MIVKPRIRGFICTTAHPTGCQANVQNQIDYVQSQGPVSSGEFNGREVIAVVLGSDNKHIWQDSESLLRWALKVPSDIGHPPEEEEESGGDDGDAS